MKILVLADFYPPTIGGMERYVSLLSTGLAKRGHEVIVCTTGREDVRQFSEDHHLELLRFEGLFQRIPSLYKNQARKYPPPLGDPIITERLKVIIKREKPDIVHSNGWILFSFLPLKQRFGIPLVVTLHGFDLFCPKKTLLTAQNKICDKPLTIRCLNCATDFYGPAKSLLTYCAIKFDKKKLKLVDKYIAVSSFVKKAYAKNLILEDRDIVVIPNFAQEIEETPRFRQADRTLPNDFILFVGILSPDKGPDVLIEAYKKLRPETELVVIGRNHPGHSYKSSQGINVIENAPDRLVEEAYSRCRFVVIPSVFPDPCPSVAFEAMRSKKAIIGSDVGGLKDIIVDGKTGILVPPNDSKKLADAIDIFLSNTAMTYQIGINGYNRFISHYTPESVIPQIERTYQNML